MWHDFGEGAVQAVADAWEASGSPAGYASVSAGEPALDCPGRLVAAWITGLDPEPTRIPCAFTPRVMWTVRVASCDLDPETWDRALQDAWCALTGYLDDCCRPLDDRRVTFEGGTVDVSGGVVSADLDFIVEDGCD